MSDEPMDLILYKYDGWQPRLRAAAPKREWMEKTTERYAYRCLPLAIANSHGWEILSPISFEAKWDGGDANESVEIVMDEGFAPHLSPVALFGFGTMTFHIEGIFRTPPGWNLWVGGSPNLQKDAVQPLGGIIETDWSPYTFTMNWRFTRANQWVRFEQNEPIAFVFPVERGALEKFKPRFERLEDNPELRRQFEMWSESRNAFQAWVKETNPAAPSDKWQKLYYRGLDSEGKPGPDDHQSKLRVKGFANFDGSVTQHPEAQVCPMKHAPQPQPQQAAPQPNPAPANTLNWGGGGASLGAPNYALALNRIGFDAKPLQPGPATGLPRFEAPAGKGNAADTLAMKRRDWILGVQSRQRLLNPRTREVPRVSGLSGADFLDLYYSMSQPVVIEGALDQWPALGWTPDHLAKVVGPAPIEFQSSRTGNPDFELDKDAHKAVMPFDQYMAAIEADPFGNDRYITAYNNASNMGALAPLFRDIGFLEEYLTRQHGMMWIGPMGTFTPLHFDLTNNLIAQVVGSKHLVLAPPSEAHLLFNHRHVFSQVHDITDEARLSKFPLARGATTFEVELNAGDMIYMPLGWWHQVTATDFSVTLTYTNFLWPNEGHATYPQG